MKAKAVLPLIILALGWIGVTTIHDPSQATTRSGLIRPVDVTITDRAIERSRTSLERGTIAEFRVANESAKPRNFVVGVERTAILDPGERDKLIVELEARGPLPYRVTVNCVLGLQGLFSVL